MTQSLAAGASVEFSLPAGATLNLSGRGVVHITPAGSQMRELVMTGSTQQIGPYRTDASISLLGVSSGLTYETSVGYGTVGDPVTVSGTSGLGVDLTANLAPGWVAS